MVRSTPLPLRIASRVFLVAVAVFMLGPLAVVVGAAFTTSRFLSFPPTGFSLQWFAEALSDATYIAPFLFSLQVAVATAAATAVLGTLFALGIARHSIPGSGVLQAIAMSPLTMPSIIFAIAMLQTVSQVLGGSASWILVLAHVIVTVPYVIRTVLGVIARSDSFTEEAARTMGARWWQRYWHVLLPICRPGIVAGAFLAFIVSFDDAVLALFLRTPQFETLPLAIYGQLEFSASPTVAAVSTMSMALTAISILAIEKIVGLGKVFS
ncbi:ABC transporter permease [Arthrobacter sp. 35W]|uniref:ABC transporter permease n=1 Tax=Arthrobacter sp. 35W TaxID=1132441 RepID=UPI00040072F9|nr:ABC transporter permease [Arthrobacter sp. 35W]